MLSFFALECWFFFSNSSFKPSSFFSHFALNCNFFRNVKMSQMPLKSSFMLHFRVGRVWGPPKNIKQKTFFNFRAFSLCKMWLEKGDGRPSPCCPRDVPLNQKHPQKKIHFGDAWETSLVECTRQLRLGDVNQLYLKTSKPLLTFKSTFIH